MYVQGNFFVCGGTSSPALGGPGGPKECFPSHLSCFLPHLTHRELNFRKMLRSVIDASVRRTGVWPRLHSTRLIGGRRVLPAVTELQCHLQPANTLKNTWIQSKTSVRLGIFVHHLGAARHLHINRGIRQQSSHAAAASAVEM